MKLSLGAGRMWGGEEAGLLREVTARTEVRKQRKLGPLEVHQEEGSFRL